MSNCQRKVWRVRFLGSGKNSSLQCRHLRLRVRIIGLYLPAYDYKWEENEKNIFKFKSLEENSGRRRVHVHPGGIGVVLFCLWQNFRATKKNSKNPCETNKILAFLQMGKVTNVLILMKKAKLRVTGGRKATGLTGEDSRAAMMQPKKPGRLLIKMPRLFSLVDTLRETIFLN